ncbi:MAG: hypothetical protein ACK5PS_06510 [Desulfopila sp.]
MMTTSKLSQRKNALVRAGALLRSDLQLNTLMAREKVQRGVFFLDLLGRFLAHRRKRKSLPPRG